ncbi:MAG: TIM-barrel domain-containing protein [Capsulimonas sp.]|uniref:glycoside hydrolase family 31 protein n=1 Tax=Capsulimonas sp. TaxID=2494211 RepID=UPI003267D7F2
MNPKIHFPLLLTLALAGQTAGAAPLAGVNAMGQLVPAGKAAPAGQGFAYAKLQCGVQIQVNGVTKNILFYGSGIVRVNANLGRTYTAQPSLVVVKPPTPTPFTVTQSADALKIASVALHILVDKKTGALTFLRPNGTIITREDASRPAEIKEVTISDAPTYEVKQTFTLSPNESLYGLGQYNQRYMDYRGKEVLLVQTNIGSVVPLLVSTRRYGVMWDIYSKSIFKDDAQGASFWAESAPAGVDYYFIAGQDMDGVIRGYRNLTGRAPMFPKSAYGLWMSKERYQTQQRLIDVTRNFRKDGFPLDNIVQDWQYWGGADGTWSGMTWDKTRYPDPVALTKTLHNDLHVKLMNSIWPSVGNDTALAHELDAHGLRHEPLHWISKKARIYDAYSPEGRAIYFKHIKKGLLDAGVDALWMDGTEVEVGGACHDPQAVEADIKRLGKNALGDYTRYLNTYTLVTTKGTYEGQRATSNKRVFTLTRSSFTGQQRYAALPWSGDTTASWETLRSQISGGVNIAMAGQPYWTQDTGGFFVNYPGGENNPEYRELYARWNQFGAFNPIYRIHGTNIEREPYLFHKSDLETYNSLLDAAKLRYRLMPYIYSLAWQSTSQGGTIMRGLPMDFPDDRAARKIDDQFLFGRSFLVHPITRAMYHAPAPPPSTIPTEALTTPDGRPGLAVQYFSGRNFEQAAGKTIDATVDHQWPGPPLADPPPGLTGFNDFSARWEGFITMPEDGEYEIGGEGDDGIRMWLDDKQIVDDWSEHAMRWVGQKLSFHKGQKVAVKIEYFQGGLERGVRLGWRTPSQIAGAVSSSKIDNVTGTYLPRGASWVDFWTNQRFAGGQTVKKAVPLNLIPLYIRAGSIVPMGPVMQYATEKPGAPYEIRVYPGADARFTLYEDDNETYNYEKGQYATVELIWSDAARTLTVGKRSGSFPGMIASRKLNIVVARPGQNPGIAEGRSSARAINYTGAKSVVKF